MRFDESLNHIRARIVLSDHLSTQLLEGYGQRRLEAAELLDMDSHISTCAPCREKLRAMKSRSAALIALRESLRFVSEAASAHPSHDILTAYIGSRLDEVDREPVESHLEACHLCAAQTEALNDRVAGAAEVERLSILQASRGDSRTGLWASLMSALTTSSLRARFWRLSLTRQVTVAVAVAGSLVLVFAWWPRVRDDGRELGNRASPPAPQSSAGPPPEPRQSIPEPPLLALNDGAGQITIDAQGNFAGIESFSPVDQQRVIAALKSRKLRMSKALDDLRESSAPLMGGSSESALTLHSPISEIIAGDRPTFRWRRLGGAISYQVTITDPASDYREIASSPQLRGLAWTPSRPLERGRIYAWQVIARTEDGEVNAPGPNAPEARFKVLEWTMANELARAKRVYAGRRLALALRYVEAGLLDEAERELKAIASANPQSPLAKSLWQEVRAKRRWR
jgi:hypothetical protein